MYNLMRRAVPEFAQVLVTFVDELHTPPAELLDICVEIVQVRRVGSHVKPDRGRPDVVEEFDTPAFRAALDLTLRKWKPAIAQLEFTQMAAYASECAPAKTVLVEHDITIDLYQQLLERSEGPRTGPPTRTLACVREDGMAQYGLRRDYVGERPRRSVAGARKVIALPNGVDLERFKPVGR